MKLRCDRSALHARAQLLIPWLANGSLPPQSEPLVRQHVAECPECRADHEEQQRVCRAMRADGPLVFAAESSYQKLLARLQGPDSGHEPRESALRAHPSRASSWSRRPATMVRWLAAAAILEAFALGLGAWAWHFADSSGGGRYMTLTSAPRSYDGGPRARVVFSKDLSVGRLRTLLHAAGAHIIDGPADGDVYTLGFTTPTSAAQLHERIAALHADPAILFAEPVPHGVR